MAAAPGLQLVTVRPHQCDAALQLALPELRQGGHHEARQLVALLPDRPTPAAAPAVAMLRAWDGRLDAESGAAALFENVWRDLSQRMLAAVVPAQAKALVTEIAPSVLLGLIAHPDARLGPDPAAARDAMLNAALAAGWDNAAKLLGPDPKAWRWGSLHRVRLTHPLARIPAIAAAFPPIEGTGAEGGSGGDSYTVMARWLGGGPGWNVGGGASWLQVIDVGDWDKSVMLMLPGQTIDPASRHARDFYAPWIGGEMKPLWFTRAAVDANTERRATIAPKGTRR